MSVTALRQLSFAPFLVRLRPQSPWPSLAIAAIYTAALTALIYSDYRSTVESIALVNTRTADLEARHTRWVLENSLQTLNRAQEIISSWDRRDINAGEGIAARLNDLVVANQAIGSIWAVGENALPLIDHTTASPAYGFAGDRSYFRIHAHGRETAWLGPADMGTLVPRRRFTLSLPLTTEGRFAGVVVVGLDAEFFSRLYGLVEWYSVTQLALLSGDDQVLASWPRWEEPRQVASAADATMTATRQIESFDARITVSADPSAALAAWRARSLWLAGLSGLGMISLGGLVFYIQRSEHERVRQSEERLLEAQRHAAIGNWEANLETGQMEWSQTVFEIFGRNPRIFIPTLTSFRDAIYADDRVVVGLAEAKASSEGALDVVYRIVRLDGAMRYVHERARLVRDKTGRPTWLAGTVQDVTEQKTAEQKVQLLVREINHRAKNLLAVVQSMARHTAAESDPGIFTERFAQRLTALAACHDLLVKNAWTGVDLENLVQSQLAPFSDQFGTRARLTGPTIRVNPQAAQALGMALHELATNANKYGALSNIAGRVSIEWQIEGEGDETTIRVCWSEHGGPPVRQPDRLGFGSKLLREMVEIAIGAEVTIDYGPSGVMWKLVAPADRVLEKAEAVEM